MDATAIKQIKDLHEGDMLEHGALLSNLDGGKERVAWVCLENVKDDKGVSRVTLHGYYYGVFVKTAVASIQDEDKIEWRIQ